MGLPKHKYILIVWAAVIFIGGVVTQFWFTNLNVNFTVWAVLIIAGIAGSSYFTNWKSKMQQKVQLAWIALILLAFSINWLSYHVLSFAILKHVNIYQYWTVVDAIGYYFTARDASWPEMKSLGLLSLLTIVLFMLPPLAPYQPLVFAIVQSGLLCYFAAS